MNNIFREYFYSYVRMYIQWENLVCVFKLRVFTLTLFTPKATFIKQQYEEETMGSDVSLFLLSQYIVII